MKPGSGLRIQVDARMLRAGGIGRYLREVTGPWLVSPRVAGIHFLGRPEALEPWLASLEGVEKATVQAWRHEPYSPGAQLRWRRLQLDRPAHIRPQVTFFPHYDVPLWPHPTLSVVTVHDLTQYRLPQHFPPWKRKAGMVLLKGALSRATRIVAVSEHARKDLCGLDPRVSEKIEVIPNGVSGVFRPPTPEEAREARARIAELHPYLLAMGDPRPHKNLALAVKVAVEARKTRPELNLVLPVSAEEDSRGFSRVEDGIRGILDSREFPRWIRLIPDPGDEDLRDLFALSEAFLFPSLYEGFGLPPLEALASGARVLASDRGALPEVLGGQARLLNPQDLEAWVRALWEGGPGEGRSRMELAPAPAPDDPGPGRPDPREEIPGWARASRDTLQLLISTVSAVR